MIDIKRKLLYKCTGFCDSTSKPVLPDFIVSDGILTECCIPQTYIIRVVPFPERAFQTLMDLLEMNLTYECFVSSFVLLPT